MQDICCKLSRTAAVVVILLAACVGSTWATTGVIGASNPWQIGDVIVCFGNGTCNVIRAANSNAVLENQISDLAQPNATPPIPGVSNPGFTYGVAIDNTLHVLVTDNGTSNSGGTSNIVEYTIASLNPLILTPTQVAHIPIANPSDGSGSPASGNIQAVAVNGNGELFAFNSGSADPAANIVRLTPIPNAPHTFSSTTFSLSGAGCIDTAFGLASMDLSADSSSAYFTTQGGTIQHFTFASPGCNNAFASFGPGVTLYGIADIPSGALAGVPTNCNNNPCEAILVLATGSFESDGESNVTPTSTDDVNICNSQVGSGSTYCALLLSTGGPGLTASPWLAGTPYSQTSGPQSTILDANLHVQQVNTPGTSVSSTQNSPHPTWKQDGTLTNDNAIVWADQGKTTWQPQWTPGGTNGTYVGGTVVVDVGGHVQQVTGAGAPGPGPTPPAFNTGTTTQDGLEWTFVGTSTVPQFSFWNQNTQYCDPLSCTAGLKIQDCGTVVEGACTGTGDIWQATAPSGGSPGGISGGGQPTFYDGSGNPITTPIPDNLVTWTDEGAWAATTPYQKTTQTTGCGSTSPQSCVGDASQHLWLATTTGISGPPAAPPPFTLNHGTGPCTSPPSTSFSPGCVTDGLTWTDLGTSVINRYPVPNAPHSLALDPRIRDCSTGACSTAVPSVSNFWVGDSGSSNVAQMTFSNTSGVPVQSFDASAVCNVQGCATFSSVQGLRIYGGEGSNQAGLTKLQCTTSQCALNSPSFTTSATFPVSAAPQDTNTWTLTAYNSTTSPIPLTLYASLINQASAPASGNNSGAADPGAVGTGVNGSQFVGNSRCEATTTDPSKCIIWKADVPSGLPAGAYLSEAINSPTGVDNGTDIFVDLHYDITTSVGVADPVGKTYTSVHSLHEITTQFNTGQSGCFFSSPVQGACYKTNRTTLNFTFQCPGLSQQQFLSLQNPPGPPLLSLIQRFPTANPKPAPKVIQLSTTNNKAPYRFSPSNNSYTFQWGLNAAATSGKIPLNSNASLRGCTFDPTNTVQTFCVDFTTSPTCK